MTRLPFDLATDSHRVLAVKPNATADETHAAYRHLARGIPRGHTSWFDWVPVRMARVNVAKSVLLDPHTRAAYDLSRNRITSIAAPAVQLRTATPDGRRHLDYTTALMLGVVAALALALLLYVVTGAQVAAHPAPFPGLLTPA